jgi:hypothetical protein
MLCAPLTVLLLIIVEATVVALFAVDGAPVEVCLNKLVSSFPVQLDLVSPSSPTPPPLPRDPLVNALSSPPLRSVVKSKKPFRFKIRGCLSKIPPEASQKSLPPPGICLQVSSIAGDEKLPHLSVVWCNLLRQLGRFLFNRRKARSFHPAVLATGDTSSHRRRVLLRLFFGGFSFVQVQGPLCNTIFFRGSFCTLAA